MSAHDTYVMEVVPALHVLVVEAAGLLGAQVDQLVELAVEVGGVGGVAAGVAVELEECQRGQPQHPGRGRCVSTFLDKNRRYIGTISQNGRQTGRNGRRTTPPWMGWPP
jgi:hypothetical protein